MSYQYERIVTPRIGLRLHLNENTAGCSPRVLARLRELTREDAAYYPDYAAAVDACARRFGVPTDELLLTNGLDEGILATSVSALRGSTPSSPREAIVVVPAFDMYAACSDAIGAKVVEVRLGGDRAFPLERVLGEIRPSTGAVFVTTPHNPTGSVVPHAAILAIATAAPHATVFVDEAYVDFSGDSLLDNPERAATPNVVVGRTFAKAYGLAALRVGALFGATATLAPIRRVVPPYSLNAYAAAALPVALDDREYYSWYLDQVAASKKLLYAALDRLRVPYRQSAANFVLVDFGTRCPEIVAALADRGVFVRDRSQDAGLRGHVRITSGIVDHTQRCIEALEEVA
jgi:histidinol-phosphate aminotransferase